MFFAQFYYILYYFSRARITIPNIFLLQIGTDGRVARATEGPLREADLVLTDETKHVSEGIGAKTRKSGTVNMWLLAY